MTTQLVSVVIPHYGDPAHALALVSQLMAQVGSPEFEIIVVDDASPAPYPDDPRVRVVRRERNGGFGAAVNSGVAEARHPYLLVLNSDLSVTETFVADLCLAAAPFQPAALHPVIPAAAPTRSRQRSRVAVTNSMRPAAGRRDNTALPSGCRKSG